MADSFPVISHGTYYRLPFADEMLGGYTISLRALSGRTFTILRAGLALTSIISPGLKGLAFMVDTVAGFSFTEILARPRCVLRDARCAGSSG